MNALVIELYTELKILTKRTEEIETQGNEPTKAEISEIASGLRKFQELVKKIIEESGNNVGGLTPIKERQLKDTIIALEEDKERFKTRIGELEREVQDLKTQKKEMQDEMKEMKKMQKEMRRMQTTSERRQLVFDFESCVMNYIYPERKHFDKHTSFGTMRKWLVDNKATDEGSEANKKWNKFEKMFGWTSRHETVYYKLDWASYAYVAPKGKTTPKKLFNDGDEECIEDMKKIVDHFRGPPPT